jgi:hypothetical protein
MMIVKPPHLRCTEATGDMSYSVKLGPFFGQGLITFRFETPSFYFKAVGRGQRHTLLKTGD